jgi:heterogeneous nuclear ribonucleoprotein F/H
LPNQEQIEPDEIKEDLNTFAIYFLHSQEGRPTGEAFVEFCDEKELELALTRHNRLIGHRYIEVFRSNEEQFEKHVLESVHNTKNWSSPVVRLRGLPYRCTKQNIIEFFAGLSFCLLCLFLCLLF